MKDCLPQLLLHETKFGDTLLTFAASLGRVDIVRALLMTIASLVENRSDTLTTSDFVDHETSRGKIPLIEAVRNNRGDVVLVLLEPADVKRLSRLHKRTALDWARALGHQQIARLIEKRTRLEEDVSDLFKAVSKADMARIDALTDGGAPFTAGQDVMFQRELGSKLHQVDLDMQQVDSLDAAHNEALHAKSQLETNILEREIRIKDIAERREGIVSDRRKAVGAAFDQLRLAATTDNISRECSTADPPSDYELISKALCTLFRIKAREVSAKNNSNKAHWKEIKALLEETNRFLHRCRCYHFEPRVVELAAKARVDELPGTCFELISNLANSSSHSMQSPLMKAVASWLHVVFESSAGHKLENDLVMQESSERSLLERNRIDLDVFTSRSAILQREIDTISAEIESNTKQISSLRRKLEVSQLMKFVTRGGHSVLSWAAGAGNDQIVQRLLKRGAHTALGDDCLVWCATIIQVAWRSHKSPGQSLGHTGTKDASLQWRQNLAVSLRINSLSNLIRDRFNSLRLPLAEALLNGQPQVAALLDKSDVPNSQAINLFSLFRRPQGTIPRPPSRHVGIPSPFASSSGGDLLPLLVDAGRNFSHEQDPRQCALAESLRCAIDLTSIYLENRRVSIETKISRRKVTLFTRHRNAKAKELLYALHRGDFAAVVRASEEGSVSLDYEDATSGLTPLIKAAMEDVHSPVHLWCQNSVGEKVTAVAYLLDRISPHRPTADYENGQGMTALAMACIHGRLEAIADLLDRGADARRRSSRGGRNPLMLACEAGKLDVVKLLLTRMRPPLANEDDTLKEAYNLAVTENHLDIVEFLDNVG